MHESLEHEMHPHLKRMVDTRPCVKHHSLKEHERLGKFDQQLKHMALKGQKY